MELQELVYTALRTFLVYAFMLVVMRLVAPSSNEPAEKSRELVASLCGQEGWDALVAAHDAARQRIAALWKQVREDR